MISAPHGGYVYFPLASTIYRLNIHTCCRELVATIKFAPRCLSAAPGWICCGGEYGQVAVIRLVEEDQDIGDGPVSADSRLPLDLDPSRRAIDSLTIHNKGMKESSFVRTTKVGGQVVNCVTFWFPPSKPSTDIYNAPVVVLANNDCTVTITDLRSSDELQTIKFTDCINRALISPNGRLLISIGDDPFMYVHSRSSRKQEWVQACKIQLAGQSYSDEEDKKGSFAASFSKSGKHLAVGTQYGIISVFDTTTLTDPEADSLITAFTTSRPNSKRGAVRDIEFSPEPHDLLVWTENTGRVGIADARDNFMSRQIITVDTREEGMSRVGLVDRDDIALVSESDGARYRSPENRILAAEVEAGRSDSPDLLSENIANARLRDEITSDMLERLVPHGESASFQVLQALQEQRRARDAMREARETRESEATTRNGNSVTALNRYRELLADRSTTPSSTLPNILREFTSSERSNASLRAYISERNQERERRGQQPRRRGSIILDAAGRALDREFRDLRAARTSQSEASSEETLTRLPPRLPAIGSTTSDSSTNPWAELETLYNIAVGPPVDISSRLRVETEQDRDRFHDLLSGEHSRRLAGIVPQPTTRTPEETPRRTAYRDSFVRSSTNVDPDETCGCCWSSDGRILYVFFFL